MHGLERLEGESVCAMLALGVSLALLGHVHREAGGGHGRAFRGRGGAGTGSGSGSSHSTTHVLATKTLLERHLEILLAENVDAEGPHPVRPHRVLGHQQVERNPRRKRTEHLGDDELREVEVIAVDVALRVSQPRQRVGQALAISRVRGVDGVLADAVLPMEREEVDGLHVAVREIEHHAQRGALGERLAAEHPQDAQHHERQDRESKDHKDAERDEEEAIGHPAAPDRGVGRARHDAVGDDAEARNQHDHRDVEGPDDEVAACVEDAIPDAFGSRQLVGGEEQVDDQHVPPEHARETDDQAHCLEATRSMRKIGMNAVDANDLQTLQGRRASR